MKDEKERLFRDAHQDIETARGHSRHAADPVIVLSAGLR